MTDVSGFDPQAMLDQIASATDDLLTSAAGLTDAEMREPSLLPGWSRGQRRADTRAGRISLMIVLEAKQLSG